MFAVSVTGITTDDTSVWYNNEPDSLSGDPSQGSALMPPLPGLVEADDPEQYVQENDLPYKEGAVEVLIEVEPGTDPPANYLVSIESRYQNRIKAYVYPKNLPQLAAHENVRAVRPPSQPETHN